MGVASAAGAGPGLDPDRVAEVIVGGPGSAVDERGSGYRVRAGVVLTAAHVVGDEPAVRVRFRADRPGAWTADGTVVWRDAGIDVAVVAVAEAGRPAGSVPPVRYGGVRGRDGLLPCSAMGFPRHRMMQDPPRGDGSGPRSFYRDSAHVTGAASPWSNLREGTLSLRVPPPEYDPDPAASPWQGMSGAAVWSGGCLIGLIRRHHAADGLGELAASRVDRWYEQLDGARLGELAAFIGLPARERLTVVGPPPRPDARREEVLRAVLAAERAASSALPYRFPGLRPPARDRVHVPQAVVMAAAPGDCARYTAERTPAARALASCRHLLMEGVAGAGKSTFVRRVAGALAEARLTDGPPPEEFAGVSGVAVVVPAAHLTGDAPLPVLLRDSVRGRLGVRLARELPADFFERAPDEGPWLLLVDGLDEIPDPVDRERVLGTAAADAARPDSPYRWVVTTRPLGPGEPEPLREAGFGRCALAPFDDDQLRALARSRLAGDAPGAAPGGRRAADERVAAFLREVDVSGLRQLVRTPLLAAITLAIHHRAGGQGLPSGRPGLYREFVSYLLTGREGEAGRRAAFRAAALAAGAGERAADWLYDHRVALLQHLASRTLADGGPLPDAAARWTRDRVPELPDFLVGWPEIVLGLLTGSGLLTNDEETGALRWTHRSLADYLAAREAADALPVGWPGDARDADPLLRRALAGEDQEQAVLTLACWAERRPAEAGRLLEWLAAASDGFDPLLLGHGGGIVIGEDSTRLDRHAALAGRLMAEGVAAPEPLAERILDRLLERARSMFTGDHFCRIVAAQPRRDRARSALLAMAGDDRLPPAARADAVVTLGRVLGPRPLHEATRSLLELTVPAQYNESTARGHRTVTVADARALVAHKLSRLGGMARPVVGEFLDRLFPAEDDVWGRYLAADAAVRVGEAERATALLASAPDPRRRHYGWEVSVLLRAGARERAARAAREMLDAYDPDDHWSVPQFDSEVLGVVDAYLEAALPDEARAFAGSAVAVATGRERATALAALVRAGDPGPASAALNGLAGTPADPDGEHRMDLDDWVLLARRLWEEGLTDQVRAACDALLREGVNTSPFVALSLGRLLREVGHPQHRPLLRRLAVHGDDRVRHAAALELVESGDPQGAEALLALAESPLPDIREAVRVAESLLRVKAEQDAVRLLLRLAERTPTDWWSGRSTVFDLLCRVRPAEGRRVLLGLAEARALVGEEVLDAADHLLRLGEGRAAVALADAVAARQDAGPADVVRAARLFGGAGDMERTAAACERALEAAARAAGLDRPLSELEEVVHAADFLHAEGRFGARQCALLAAATWGTVRPGMTPRDKALVLRIAELLVDGGAAGEAERLLAATAGHGVGDDTGRRVARALRGLRDTAG
ncbi:hypothetical protein GCM10027168_60770 [Streptomyces capparidis]